MDLKKKKMRHRPREKTTAKTHVRMEEGGKNRLLKTEISRQHQEEKTKQQIHSFQM